MSLSLHLLLQCTLSGTFEQAEIIYLFGKFLCPCIILYWHTTKYLQLLKNHQLYTMQWFLHILFFSCFWTLLSISYAGAALPTHLRNNSFILPMQDISTQASSNKQNRHLSKWSFLLALVLCLLFHPCLVFLLRWDAATATTLYGKYLNHVHVGLPLHEYTTAAAISMFAKCNQLGKAQQISNHIYHCFTLKFCFLFFVFW